MGLFGRIVIALLLSTPVFSQNSSRQGLASILQNLLTSNPQLLKMANRPLCNDYYGRQTPVIKEQYVNNYQNQYRKPTLIEMPYPIVQPGVPIQPVPVQPGVPIQPVPVQTVLPAQPVKELAYQYPVSHQQVQTVSQSYVSPGFPKPPIPYSPASLVNPFLPAASPMSALAPPTSSFLPPMNPSITKNHFLRKVPFPPPCI